MNIETDRLLTAEELGQVLKLSRSSVWRLARSGNIPVMRAGRLMRFDLAKVLRALEEAGGEEA